MFDPSIGDVCMVTIKSVGGTNEDPPTLYPPVPCRVAYKSGIGSVVHGKNMGLNYSVVLLRDAKPSSGWYRGDTYRADQWQLKPAEQAVPA